MGFGGSVRARSAGAAFALAALVLAGCSTYDLPQASEISLRLPGGSKVSVTDLRCFADGVVLATGLEVSGASAQGGVLLRSEDRGLNWTASRPDPSLSAVTPWFLDDPRAAGKTPHPLYVTGYANAGIVRAMVDWTPAIGTWLVSLDEGASWAKTTPLAPFGTTVSVGADPQPLVMVDGAGTLATVKTEGRLNVLGDTRAVLVRSRDGGRTWSESTLPHINGEPHALVGDGRGGLVVAGPASGAAGQAAVIRSDDGGDSWTRTLLTAGKSYFWAMRGTMDSALFLWSPMSETPRGYFRSVDGGRTWSGRTIALWRPFSALVAAGPQRWVALSVEPAQDGQEAVAWLSLDDGLTWSARPTGIRRGRNYEAMGWASTLVHVGDGVLIAHAGGSRVARSADGGETWQLVEAALPDRDFGFSAHCTDGRGTVVLGSEYGLLTRSTDRGLTWRAGQIAGAGKP